jgi:uncharacterized protein
VHSAASRVAPHHRVCLVFAAVFLLVAPGLAALDVPYLSGHVNDTAGMIPAAVRDRLEDKLAAFEKQTGAQVAVLTVPGLAGEVLEDYSLKVAETWKLGRKGVDDGVLVLIARDDRKMRIEVGYGLEGKLTDAQCRRILDNVIRPAFRNGEFGKGVEAGVDAVTGTIQGKDVIPTSPPSASKQFSAKPIGLQLMGIGIFVLVIGVFSLLALLSKGAQSWFLYVFLVPFWAVFPLAFFGSAGLVALLAWVVGFPIAKHWLHGTRAGKSFLKGHPGLVAFAASGGHSGSGSGWSSGGFSGGGGGFGGGGASGGW